MTGEGDRAGVVAGRLPVATGRQNLPTVWGLLRRRPGRLAVVVLVLLVGAAAGLVTPWALGVMVDRIEDGTATGAQIWTLGAWILAAALVGAVSTGIGLVLAARVFETILAALREEFIDHALALPQGTVEQAGTGDLVSRASDDIAQVSDAIPRIVPALTTALFTLIVTLAGLVVLDWRFALALLITVPVYALTVRWYLRTAPAIYAAERAVAATRAHHVLASLRGLDTVLAYRLTGTHATRIAEASWQVVTWAMRARVVQNMLLGRLHLAEYLGLVALLAAGFWMVQDGAASIGGATTAILLLLRMFAPIGQVMFVLDDAQAAAAALSRVVGLTHHHEAADNHHSPSTDTGRALASLDRVTFSYSNDAAPVLHEVSLRIRAGQRVALVGASGAGKTTIAALLAGIHQPTAGTITSPERTLLLSQETHVFTGTLTQNLTLARPAATESELHTALAQVHATGLTASLPDGLDTQVGHGGHTLTAAQSQQLALARLVLADPALAILDEATAEADSADAGLLDRAADAALAGRTGLVIAHRLSQAAVCDRIVVMDRGRVVETGTHDELIAADGVYAGLWAAWRHGQHGDETATADESSR